MTQLPKSAALIVVDVQQALADPGGVNAIIRRQSRTSPACSQPGEAADGRSATWFTIRPSPTASFVPAYPAMRSRPLRLLSRPNPSTARM